MSTACSRMPRCGPRAGACRARRRRAIRAAFVTVAALSAAACAGSSRFPVGSLFSSATAAGDLAIRSPAFEPGASIPVEYTCDGVDVSPPLVWDGVPTEARSLVLIVDDPDVPDPAAPRKTWVHWVLYNLPPTTKGLPHAVTAASLPVGTYEGRNGWKRSGYAGPCPPIGRHRYVHKLYALDVEVPALEIPSKRHVVEAMQGHILAHAEMIGTYARVVPLSVD